MQKMGGGVKGRLDFFQKNIHFWGNRRPVFHTALLVLNCIKLHYDCTVLYQFYSVGRIL